MTAPRRLVYGLLLAAFACRALVPVGFMPASLEAGGPVVVCPGGTAGAFFRLLERPQAGPHAAHEQHQHAPDEFDAWEYCPQGALLSAAVPTSTFAFTLPVFEHVLKPAEPALLVEQSVPARYQARAPPRA